MLPKLAPLTKCEYIFTPQKGNPPLLITFLYLPAIHLNPFFTTYLNRRVVLQPFYSIGLDVHDSYSEFFKRAIPSTISRVHIYPSLNCLDIEIGSMDIL
jgi:hypothetical protein